jgi:hypothetical protein
VFFCVKYKNILDIMSVQKKTSGTTMLIIGAVIGIIAGAFLPDSLSPMVLFKKKAK